MICCKGLLQRQQHLHSLYCLSYCTSLIAKLVLQTWALVLCHRYTKVCHTYLGKTEAEAASSRRLVRDTLAMQKTSRFCCLRHWLEDGFCVSAAGCQRLDSPGPAAWSSSSRLLLAEAPGRYYFGVCFCLVHGSTAPSPGPTHCLQATAVLETPPVSVEQHHRTVEQAYA